METPTPTRDLRKEIESHSSQLTNLRINEIKLLVVKLGYEVSSSKPHPIRRLQLFNAIMQYFLETKDAYLPDDLKKIEEQVMKANKIAARMRMTGAPGDMENMLQICFRLQYMINHALQNMKYFFRIGKHDPKGIDAALAIFKENVWKEDADTISQKA